ncbi:MAG: hypothetical protein AB8V79_04345 [Candidatus Midichloria sp.]
MLLGVGDGTFRAAINYNVEHNPNGLAVGDFNEDGSPDITVPNGGGGTTINVLINRGDGTFLLPTTLGWATIRLGYLMRILTMILIWT